MDQQTLHTALFWLLAGATSACAVLVVVSQNIVRAAAWLLFALAGSAGIFFLLGADFIGATQLIVYVGGTLVLVVFGVMLTAQGPFISMKTGPADWAMAGVLGLLLLGVLALSVLQSPWPVPRRETMAANSTALGLSLLGVEQATPDAKVTGLPEAAQQQGQPVRTKVSYLLPFEIVSVHLLVVLIGAAYLARAKRRKVVEGLKP